jgi:hypothetical protein
MGGLLLGFGILLITVGHARPSEQRELFLLLSIFSRPSAPFRSLLLDHPVQHIDDFRPEVPSSVRRAGRQLNKTVEDLLWLMFYAGPIEVQPTKSCIRFDLVTAINGSETAEQTDILPLYPPVF